MPLFSFYTLLKYQKTIDFLMFSGGIEGGKWHGMGQRQFEHVTRF